MRIRHSKLSLGVVERKRTSEQSIMDNLDGLLLRGARDLGLKLTPGQREQFSLYRELLLERREKVNLTGFRGGREIVIKHFLDSLTCCDLVASSLVPGQDWAEAKTIDLGSGAGFPGIPLKIVLPSLRLTLLDSRKKAAHFLKDLCRELALQDVEIIEGRAEDWGRDREFREKYDLVLSRALAALNVLVELSLPFLRVGGILLAQKGPAAGEEAGEARGALDLLGGRIESIRKVKLPLLNEIRNLVIIEKKKPTPGKYPRRAGIPRKRPL